MKTNRASIVVQWFCYCFIAGTLVGFYTASSFWFVVVGLVVVWVLLTTSIVINTERWWCAFAVVSGLLFGVIGMNFYHQSNIFARELGNTVSFEGVVSMEPTQTEKSQTITIKPNGVSGNVRASVYLPISAQVGDLVWVRGTLALPENFSDFNYVGYLERHNVLAIIKKPRIIVLKRGKPTPRSLILRFKLHVIKRAEKVLDTNSSSLVLGMLIGYRQSLPEDIQENFRKTGLSHIVAVSGSNMTIIATSLGVLAWAIGRRQADIASLVIIVGFTVLTGASAAVVRAAIMAMLVLVARVFGRSGSSFTLLLFASVLMLINNPLLLFYDIGFQLSVVATLGVLWAMQFAAHWEKDGFWVDILYPTMGAIIMTTPIVAYHFGTVSLIAPVANAVVLPVVSIIMALGFTSLFPGVGLLAAPVVELIIKLELWFVAVAASLKWSSALWHVHGAIVISYYLVALVFVRVLLKTTKKSALNSASGYAKISKITI